MNPTSKWIDGIDADSSVHDAARRSLEGRLTAVIQALPLAAHLADYDVEYVHRLRVSTRRALAAVKLYEELLPRKQFKWLKKRLKKVRRAAGDARDLDVLALRLAEDYGERAKPVVEFVQRQRAKAQPDIVEVAERCRRDDRFVRKTSKLLAGVDEGQEGEAKFGDWAASRLANAVDAFFGDMPADASDTAALHQFRIRGKQLRYTIELVASAFPAQLRSEMYPVVEELQERLGNVQDHVAAIANLNEWADAAEDAELQNLLHELAEEEREGLIDALGDFRDWWSDERRDNLRSGLTELLRTEPATEPPPVVQQT
jgi:CHAD domain-containing protein